MFLGHIVSKMHDMSRRMVLVADGGRQCLGAEGAHTAGRARGLASHGRACKAATLFGHCDYYMTNDYEHEPAALLVTLLQA